MVFLNESAANQLSFITASDVETQFLHLFCYKINLSLDNLSQSSEGMENKKAQNSKNRIKFMLMKIILTIYLRCSKVYEFREKSNYIW